MINLLISLSEIKSMESKRQLQVAELIKRNFGMVLFQEGSYIYGDALVTVTNVKVSPDMGLAKIYLSVYNTDNKQEVLMLIDEQRNKLRQMLGHRLKRHVRRIPQINFYLDDLLDEMYRLNALFDCIKDEEE